MPEDRMAVQERDAEHKQYTQPDQAADVINANFYKEQEYWYLKLC